MTEKQTQKSGDNSTNLQAENISITQGISYSEAKEIASDVFKNNFIELSSVANEIVFKRVEEFVNEYLQNLKNKNEKLLNNVQDPGIQYSIFEAQKAYARTGDKDLFNLLVNVLLERTENSDRNLKQIVLEESLTILPKLTQDQLNVLTIIFLIKYSQNNNLLTLKALNNSLMEEFSPFCNNLSKDRSCYQHLEYVGCGSISVLSENMEKIFRRQYSMLFSKGFEKEAFESQIGQFTNYDNLIMPSLREPEKYQLRAFNEFRLKEYLEIYKIPKDSRQKINNLYNHHIMSEKEVKEDLLKRADFMEHLFDVWENSNMKNMTITSVGLSLAHANYHIKTGKTLELGIWIK